MLVEVLRPFPGADPKRPHQPGEVLDTAQWVPGRDFSLIKRRYVMPYQGEQRRGPGRPRKEA